MLRRAYWALWLAAGCGDAPGPRESASGRSGFEAYCAGCHQADGKGMEGGGPPLAGSPWVTGPESRLIRIVLHGVRGPMTVNGMTVDREMLGFGPILTDEAIASLLTYLRGRFGGGPPVASETIRRVRDQTRDRTDYWTVAELLAIPPMK